MAAARRWQQRWAAEGKVCSGNAGHLNPPPYRDIGKGEERLAAPNQRSDGGDNPPMCARGIFNPWRGGGAPCSALPAAQLQRGAFFSRGRSTAVGLCCPHSELFLLKRSPRGRQKMVAAQRWQQRWAAEGKFAARMQATLIPPPTRRLVRERSALQHLTSAATEGTIPPCALEGSLTPGGGEECHVAHRQQRSYSAGHFLPSVEAQLWLFVIPTPTHFCCCCIASSGPTLTTTINDDALIECTQWKGRQDDATTTTAMMTMLLWGGGKHAAGPICT
jgi:hypothetical protein